jgi:hypothetical protein
MLTRMRSGTCPKCSQTTVRECASGICTPGTSGDLRLKLKTKFLTTAPSLTEHTAYVCVSCGYFEQYITNPETLAAVAEQWQETTG